MSQVAQSKMISLVPTNGTEFTLNSGQKCIFEVPPNLGLVKGRDSYLCIDVVNTSTDFSRLALNTSAGVDSVINRVDIYSLQHGTHLETLQNYNQWTAVSNQYLYEDKTNLQSLTGCGKKVFSQEVVGGNLVPVQPQANHLEDTIVSPITTSGVQVYNYRRFTTPLKAGIMSWWQDERLCPVVAFGGLRIEITFESPKTALHYIKSVAKDGTTYDITPASADGMKIGDGQAGANILTDLDFNDVEHCGFAVDNLITITSAEGANINDGKITALQMNGDKVQVTHDGTAVPGGQTNIRIKHRTGTDTRSAKVRPQFRVVSMAPPSDMISRISGGFQYEFVSYDLLLSSLISSALRHESEINSVANRAVCIITAFADPVGYENQGYSTYFSGNTPAELNLNSVQYFMDNKLQPVRAYNPQKNNDKVVTFNEVVKALSNLSYEAKDLGNDEGANLEEYTNMFVIARQLAKRPFNYNLKDAEPQIRLGFSAARANNVQVLNYVWSKKIVNVGANGDLDVML